MTVHRCLAVSGSWAGQPSCQKLTETGEQLQQIESMLMCIKFSQGPRCDGPKAKGLYRYLLHKIMVKESTDLLF